MLRLLLNEKNLSVYRLEKESHISHATLNDLYNEKTNIDKCSISLIYNVAKTLNISIDKLYSILSYNDLSLIAYDEEFDLFKSNVCHELARIDYKMFLKKYLTDNVVNELYKNKETLKALYVLSMIDYLCAIHNLPVPKEYDEIRNYKLDKLYVSKSVFLLLKSRSIKITDLCNESIDVFLKHNIMEANIYDVK